MSISRTWRIAGLSLATVILAAACSSSGATTAPSASADAGASQAPVASDAGTGGAAIPAPPTSDVTLQGAGATFPAPLYQSWFEAYSALYPNIKVDYQAVGSGAGIKAITQQTIDFGATDAAMKDEEISPSRPGRRSSTSRPRSGRSSSSTTFRA